MKFKNAMIAWNIGGGIQVVPWPDYDQVARHLRMSCGACFTETENYTPEQCISQVFIDFATIIVRDGVCPKKAHKAFLLIDEYRDCIAADARGS